MRLVVQGASAAAALFVLCDCGLLGSTSGFLPPTTTAPRRTPRMLRRHHYRNRIEMNRPRRDDYRSISTTLLQGRKEVVNGDDSNDKKRLQEQDDDDYVFHTPIQTPAGPLYDKDERPLDDGILAMQGQKRKKRVLVLCTGGTLAMAPDPLQGNSLAPVEGALTDYLKQMPELDQNDMPQVVAHEYSPLIDSSDMGPGDWALLASDIGDNYYYFDGFVVLTGTDTMAYAASALSFMLESLGKPVVFTGSQIPLNEPYNDARKNLIMSIIFACRETIHEVTIFFHDRLVRFLGIASGFAYFIVFCVAVTHGFRRTVLSGTATGLSIHQGQHISPQGL